MVKPGPLLLLLAGEQSALEDNPCYQHVVFIVHISFPKAIVYIVQPSIANFT